MKSECIYKPVVASAAALRSDTLDSLMSKQYCPADTMA